MEQRANCEAAALLKRRKRHGHKRKPSAELSLRRADSACRRGRRHDVHLSLFANSSKVQIT